MEFIFTFVCSCVCGCGCISASARPTCFVMCGGYQHFGLIFNVNDRRGSRRCGRVLMMLRWNIKCYGAVRCGEVGVAIAAAGDLACYANTFARKRKLFM